MNNGPELDKGSTRSNSLDQQIRLAIAQEAKPSMQASFPTPGSELETGDDEIGF